MHGFSTTILVVLIIILAIHLFINYTMRESTIVKKISSIVNGENFTFEQLEEIRNLLEAIRRLPSAIKYDISGDYTVLSTITNEISNLTPEEAKNAINKILNEYDNSLN